MPVNGDSYNTSALERRSSPSITAGGFVFLQRVEIVEPLQEKQVGDLLDDYERVGDTAGPEGIPESVDFTADFAGEHESGGKSLNGAGVDSQKNRRSSSELRPKGWFLPLVPPRGIEPRFEE